MIIRETLQNWYFVSVDKMKSDSYTKMVALAMCGLILFSGAFLGYRWHKVSRAQEVQKVLGECIDEYRRAQAQDSTWQNAELLFSLGHDHYGSTQLGSYFLAGKAHTLIKQGKFAEALDGMKAVVTALPKKAPAHALYAVKYAVMRMDTQDQVEAGLADLQLLAHDEKNAYRDVALYYLGLYYWSKNDLAQAKAEWQTLVAWDKQRPQDATESSWAGLVKERLEQIV